MQSSCLGKRGREEGAVHVVQIPCNQMFYSWDGINRLGGLNNNKNDYKVLAKRFPDVKERSWTTGKVLEFKVIGSKKLTMLVCGSLDIVLDGSYDGVLMDNIVVLPLDVFQERFVLVDDNKSATLHQMFISDILT